MKLAVVGPSRIAAALLACGFLAQPISAQDGLGVDPPQDAAEVPYPHAEPEEVGLSAEALADLADLVRGWTRDTLIVGAEILVVKDGRAVLHEATGWSDLEAGEPMRKHSIFRLLALTKPFTGTAALMLAEEGRLELDAPVSRWIPSWANDRSGEVTVRQLLTHTGGWEQYGTPRPRESYPSLRAMVDDAGRHGPQHPPGRAYRYSDVHSYALGALVEEVSGTPVERYIERQVLELLGLDDTHTRFIPEAAWAHRVSSRYQLEDGTWTKVWSPDRPQADPFFRASGGLFSTAMDYARWLEAWMTWAGFAPDGEDTPDAASAGEGHREVPRLLSQRTAREALTPHRGPYGYHWEILSDDPLVFGHGGVDGTQAMAIPSRDLIAVYLTQSQGRELRGEWTAAALDAVAPDLELHRPLASLAAEEAGLDVVELTPSERAAYAGRYGSDGDWLRIFEEDGRLHWRLPSPGSPRVTLVPLGDHTFATGRYEAGELAEVVLPLQRMRFVVEDGQATALELMHDGEVRVELPRAEPADDQTYPNPHELAAAHVEAIGGRAAIEAVRGYHAIGTAEIPGQSDRATVEEWILPGEGWRKRWDVDGFGRVEQGFVGQIAWLVRPDRPADAVRDAKYRESVAARTVLHPETDLLAHLGSARTVGRREIAGRSAWEVRIKGPSGSVQSRFYDEETGLLRAVERDELLAGQLTRILTVYEDWGPVDGVLFPHRMTRTAANGFEDVTVLESVTTGPIPPEAVRPPAEVVAAASEDRFEVEIERDVMVPMRDGVRLATDIHRPRGAGDRLPVVLIRTPYDKIREGEEAFVTALAERGYVVVVQDERGKWASEGEFVFFDKQSSRNDGYDTVEWIVSQPWSNGRVGTYGCSRLGIHQYMLAAERHPAHVVMIPQAGAGAVGPNREGGAFPLSAAVNWHPRAGTKDRTDGRVRIPLPEGLHHLPTIDIMRHYGVGPTDWENLLSKPLDDPWWQTHGYIAESDSFATPALHVNSWYDFGADATLQLFNLMRRNAVDERTRDHQYVVMSPMTHCDSERATENTRVGELDVGDARLPYWQIYLDWFEHWLKGEENGVTDMPRVQYYVTGANEWRSADDWPVPGARPTRLYLHSGGAAGERLEDGVLSAKPPIEDEPADRYIYDPGNPVPSSSESLFRNAGAYDQSKIEQRADVLVYTTTPLDDPLDVVGPLRATLYVSSSAPDTDFTVKLVDVHPDGRAFNVQQGIIRARYREGFDRTVWMRPGEVYEVEVDLHATAHRFRAGHRVRIEVSSSNFPRFDRNLNSGGDNVTETEWRTAENTIHHSPRHPSRLLLPVVAADSPERGEQP